MTSPLTNNHRIAIKDFYKLSLSIYLSPQRMRFNYPSTNDDALLMLFMPLLLRRAARQIKIEKDFFRQKARKTILLKRGERSVIIRPLNENLFDKIHLVFGRSLEDPSERFVNKFKAPFSSSPANLSPATFKGMLGMN